jgi:aspartyl-tRNA(Asn)/glutamyl-tRNA(Gln) amidotransferase subunit C
MPIRREDIHRLAELAQIKLEPATESRLLAELQTILEYVEAIESVDVTGVTETIQTVAAQPLRDDDVEPSLPPADALDNAPDPAAGHFRVPRVLPT